eukprot:scaffold17230_cov63-Cyclotella_meneghiniana.AAC.2
MSSILSLVIVSLTIVVCNGFISSNARYTHGSISPSFAAHNRRNNALPAVLDGILYESSQPRVDYEPDEMCHLFLDHDSTHQHSDSYIIGCLSNIVGVTAGDAYDAIIQSKGIAKCSTIDELPRHLAETYYDQLTAKGIAVGMC